MARIVSKKREQVVNLNVTKQSSQTASAFTKQK
jgi:hypothetical protein